MADFLSQNWLINRRKVLRGAGVALALPFLDCMRPLRAAERRISQRLRIREPGVVGRSLLDHRPGRWLGGGFLVEAWGVDHVAVDRHASGDVGGVAGLIRKLVSSF